jgi:hypothetical protein
VARKLLDFPHPVNEVAARTVAAGVVVMTLAALVTHALWLTVPLAYGFVARVLAGPRFSPLGTFAVRVVSPRIGTRARLVPGPPKRFAQAIGAACTCAALACWLAGADVAAMTLLALLLVPALLEAAFGYCIGCVVFARLMQAGLVPKTVCRDCADVSARFT